MAKKMKADTPESSTSATTATAGNAPDDKQSNSETSVAGQVSDMVDSAKQAGAQVLDQAKNQATVHADQQRQTLASGIQAVAHAFHSMGDDLSNREEGPVAKYAADMGHAVAGQVEQFANYLRDRDIRQLISDTEEFARRSPAVFLGGAFVIGLAASRFLKSSRPTSGESAPRASSPGPNTSGTQLALPPASTPPARTDSNLPSGFPFSSPETLQAQPAATTLPSMPTGTESADT